MKDLNDLTAEIRRIINCPYTPSLNRLRECLKDADLSVLQRWARNNPCQIEPLAASVLEGLELWPYTLNLLRKLACIPAFRDAALRKKPTLLSIFLARATESDSGFEKFSPTCVSLLSAPLETAIPSNVLLFLEKLLEKALQAPSPDRLRPVYQALSGLGPDYLNELALDVSVLARFQGRLDEVLRKIDPNDSLLCLALLAKFASRFSVGTGGSIEPEQMPLDSHGVPKDPSHVILPSRKYFVGKRGCKTLTIAVLGVISVCSANSIVGLDGALENLRLSQEIVEAVCRDDVKTWLVEKTGRPMKKLYEKILRPDIDSSLQVAALDFVAAFYEGGELPKELRLIYGKAFSSMGGSTLSPQALTLCIGSIDAVTFNEGLNGILNLACNGTTSNDEGLSKFEKAVRTVSAMTPATCTHVLASQAVSEINSSGILYRFATQGPPRLVTHGGHDSEDICLSTYMQTVNRLQQRLTVTILSMFLRFSSPEQDPDGVSMILVEKQTQMPTLELPCPHCKRCRVVPNKSTLSLFEAESTPQANSASHNWKENMVRALSRDANRAYESATRMMGEVCRDLELRCEEAERPYREEQSKSHKLEESLDASRAEIAELNVLLQGHSSNNDQLEIEKEDLSRQLMESGKRQEDQVNELRDIQQEHQQARETSERAAQAANQASRDQDMAYLATLAGKDEIIEEQANRLNELENRINELQTQTTQLLAEAAERARTINDNTTKIQELKDEINTANESIGTKQGEIDRLMKSEAALRASNEETALGAQQASDEMESELKHQLETANNQLQEAKRDHDLYARTKDAEILRLEDQRKISGDELHAELIMARNDATIADEKSQSQIANLQNKVKRLRKERDEQGKKLTEAQELAGRFMAVMDHATKQAAPPRHYSPPSVFTADDVLPEECSSPEKGNARKKSTSPIHSGTSSISGPTPKRPKTHRAPQTRRTQNPLNFKPLPTTTTTKPNRRHTMKSGRTPLADLGRMHSQGGSFSPTQRISWGNSSPKKKMVIDEEIPQEDEVVREWGSDEESFGGGDIFTSTDQQQLDALRRQVKTPQTVGVGRRSFDETTTEF